jgi:hypothetical protein
LQPASVLLTWAFGFQALRRTDLERCLQKDPRQRIRDIGDVRLVLEGAFDTAAPKS